MPFNSKVSVSTHRHTHTLDRLLYLRCHQILHRWASAQKYKIFWKTAIFGLHGALHFTFGGTWLLSCPLLSVVLKTTVCPAMVLLLQTARNLSLKIAV